MYSDMDVKWTVQRAKSGEILYYQNTVTGEKKWPNTCLENLQTSCNELCDIQSHSNGKENGNQSVYDSRNTVSEFEKYNLDQSCDSDIFPHVVHITADGLTVHTLDPDETREHNTHMDPNTTNLHEGSTKICSSGNNLISKTDVNSNDLEKTAELKVIEKSDSQEIIREELQSSSIEKLQDSASSGIRKRKCKNNVGMDVWNGFRCAKCGTTFSTQDNLSSHQKFHSKIFKCDKCCLSFTSAVFLTKHKKIHQDRNVVQLKQCDKEYCNGGNFRGHIQRQNNGKCFVCDVCAKEFTSNTAYETHKKFHKEGKLKCDHCYKTFTHRTALCYHSKLHESAKNSSQGNPENGTFKKETTDQTKEGSNQNNESKKFICEKCDKVFSNSGSLCVHRRRHSIERPFKCSQCDKGFFDAGDLGKHFRCHTGEKPYSCNECGKKFTLSGNLKRHLLVHTGEKAFKCKICEKAFKRSHHLLLHLRTHSGEKPFSCSECSKSFSRRTCLTMHMRVHSGEKPFKCPKCSKSFSGKSDLTKHQRTHSGDKPYKCEDCQKGFSQLNHLKNHRRIHTGEKPFECKICHHTFAHSQYLARHKRTHTGEKPFECSQCKKRFAQRGNLLNHLRIHSDERPYTCTECSLAFKDPSSLAKHKKIHTGARPYPCAVCKKAFKRGSHLKKHLESVHNLDDSLI